MKNAPASAAAGFSYARRRVFSALGACAGVVVCPALLAANPPLTIAAEPQFTPIQINRTLGPLLERLSALTGIAFALRYFPSIEKFQQSFGRGEPDLAILSPYHAVMAKRSQGYLPLIHSATPLTGILVVPANSPIKSIQQLEGGKIAFPFVNAFAASIFIRALLEQASIHVTPRFVNTPQNVYRNVLLGEADAGGGARRTLERAPDAVRSQLRILFETPPAAPPPLVIHPRIPPAVRERIVAAILGMTSDTDLALLAAVDFDNPVRADYARDYAPLERYHLDRQVILVD